MYFKASFTTGKKHNVSKSFYISCGSAVDAMIIGTKMCRGQFKSVLPVTPIEYFSHKKK